MLHRAVDFRDVQRFVHRIRVGCTPRAACSGRHGPFIVEFKRVREVPLGADFALGAIDLGRAHGVAASSVRMMSLDELLVGRFYSRRICSGLKPQRSTSGCIPGHRRTIQSSFLAYGMWRE